MDLAAKLKAIRAKEGVTQTQFCELLGFSVSTYKKYEASLFEMGYGAVSKVVTHPRFYKYTLWLMTDQTEPECGQVSPVQS
ncbi:helix-turn-helix domain-containing protein [Pseudomonas cichorii]|nr:helix-turn-helix domain-containing protein [Pseudomonas cichorii]